METERFFIELSYNGSAYHGWQIQHNAISVQEILDKNLSTLLRQKIETLGCGRTDTGVHAEQFYVHFDAVNDGLLNDPERFIYRVNSLLPPDVAVKRLLLVGNDTHARFDAISRSYQYRIHFDKNPFLHHFSWQMRDCLDVDAMNTAAKILLEYEDFSCFSKAHTQVFTNNCQITEAEWRVNGDQLVFYITANRFLRNMVRAIVGTLIEIGKGQKKTEHMHEVIRSQDRSKAGTSVPAHGLYLTAVEYPYI